MNLLTKFRSEIDQVLINKDDTQSPKISKSLIQEGDLTSKEKEILEYIRLNPGITKAANSQSFRSGWSRKIFKSYHIQNDIIFTKV